MYYTNYNNTLVNHEPLFAYFSNLPIITYFPNIICKLRDLIYSLDKEFSSKHKAKINSIYDEIYDDILYLQDIFSLNHKVINYILSSTMFHYLILPVLISSIQTKIKVQ